VSVSVSVSVSDSGPPCARVVVASRG
jgi:hypothetical protein